MPDEPINDAEEYGVIIVPAEVAPGTEYWRVIRVHHLTPEENQGRHHVFLDALDQEGAREYGARILATWDGGSQELVIEKPENEPGANLPMFKWQIVAVEALGMPSDRVENLRTDHPDEAPGNTLFHHSFLVVFQRAVAEDSGATGESVIQGRVPDGAGHTLILRSETVERTTTVGEDERYRFEQLPAGQYRIEDQNDGRVIGPIEVDGENSVEVDFPPPQPAPPLAHYLLFGPPDHPTTQVHLSLLAEYLVENKYAYGFSATDAAKAPAVTLVGDHPDEVRVALEAAGVQVSKLPADPSALLAAIRS